MKRFGVGAMLLLAVTSAPLAGCSHFSNSLAHLGRKPANTDVQLSMARLQEEQGAIGKARGIYENILKSQPRNAAAHHRLGVLACKAGDFETGFAFLEKARALDPNNVDILTDIGYAHYAQGDLKTAEEVLRQALSLDSANQRTINNLAMVVGTAGREEEAFAPFRQTVDEAQAHANLGYLQAQNGNGREAIARYSQALSLNQNLDSASNALVQIAAMQNKLNSHKAIESQLAQKKAANAGTQLTQSSQPTANNPPGEIVQASAVATNNVVAPAVATQPADAGQQDSPFEIIDVDVKASPSIAATEEPSPFRKMSSKAQPSTAKPQSASAAEIKSSPYVAICPDAQGKTRELLTQLDADNPAAMKRVIHQIGRLGSNGTAASPALRQLATNEDPYIRIHSALALWRIDHDAATATPILIDALEQQDPGIRSFAAAAVGEIGPQSEEAIPSLEKALKDENGYVRLHVAEALGRFDNWQDKSTEVLISCRKDSAANVRWLAT